MRVTIKYISLLLVFTLFAQDADNTDSADQSSTTGSIGTVTINGQVYNQLSLRPAIPIGKLNVGLDVYLYFNNEGMYWESWNFSNGGDAFRTIIDKIYYLQWGLPGDKFYFMAGALPSVTLGQGILVNNYANIMEYPQVRQIGFNLQVQVAGVGIEIIHSNFKTSTPGIMGIRSSYLILPQLSVGASYSTDLDQFAGLPDSDGDGYPDHYDFHPDDSEKWDDSIKARIEWDGFNTFLRYNVEKQRIQIRTQPSESETKQYRQSSVFLKATSVSSFVRDLHQPIQALREGLSRIPWLSMYHAAAGGYHRIPQCAR